MSRFVLFDGEPAEGGMVSLDADDPTLILGCGVFETLRTYEGQLFGVGPHLERLEQSAAMMGLPEFSREDVSRELETAAAQIDGEAVVRVTLTGGGHRIVRAAHLPVFPREFRCATRPFVPPAWLDGRVKHTSRGSSVRAVEQAGVDEVIWIAPDGALLEGTRSNVFAVKNGALYTPALDGRMLAGVTRAFLLEAARTQGVPVCEEPIHADAQMDELYVSSTLKELTPIIELDGEAAPGGGPIGEQVLAAFRKRVAAGPLL